MPRDWRLPMKIEYKNLLQKFWSEGSNYFELSLNKEDIDIINSFFYENSINQIKLFIFKNKGVRQDYAEAEKWYRLAAEQGNQGNAEAQYNLGAMYSNGDGVPQDDAEKLKWYRLAAEQGNAEAQYNLGLMYANGETGFFSGWEFFDQFFDEVEELHYEKFLNTVWIMFDNYMENQDDADTWHPWRSQFDPLDQINPEDKHAKLFREGVIRFELSDDVGEAIEALKYTYYYGWWKNLHHFLMELITYRNKDFVYNYINEIALLLFPEKKFQNKKTLSKHEMVNHLILFLDENTQSNETVARFADEDLGGSVLDEIIMLRLEE
jgi:hypothetical protein